MKAKKKTTGTRKAPKVSVSKLSNKRLNKLAKQGKLKKKLPKGHFLQLLHERTQQKALNEKGKKDAQPVEIPEKPEQDIPLEEADYDYYAKPGRDFSFLSDSVDDSEKQPRGKKRKKKDDHEDGLESAYEKRLQSAAPTKEYKSLLPIKGKTGIMHRQVEIEDADQEEANNDDEEDTNTSPVEEAPQEPLPVLSAADLFLQRQAKLSQRKEKIASLASSIMENPEANVRKLKELRLLLEESDPDICVTVKKYAMVSLMEIFKDIIPGYRIRELTELEKKQAATKDTKQLRDFEESLLNNFKHYLEVMEGIAKGKATKSADRQKRSKKETSHVSIPQEAKASLRELALKCMGDILVQHPHFNFRTNIISVIVPFIDNKNATISNMICEYVKKIFREDKSGEVILEVTRLIGRIVKSRNFNVQPKVLETFLSLKIKVINSGKEGEPENKATRREKYRKMSRRDRKKQKQMGELEKELQDVAIMDNKMQRRRLHTEIIKMVFLTYFRILKQATHSVSFSVVLEGLAKFAHLINIEFFDDLFNVFNQLIKSGELSYRESLHCVQTAFTILSGQGSALNVDPLHFYTHLYSTLFHLHAGYSSEDVPIALACLDEMLVRRRRQVSHPRSLAFIKRLSTLTLQLPHHGVLATLASLRSYLHADTKSDILYDTDSQGSGVFMAELSEPEHCNAHNTALYELHLLKHHYHPTVCQYTKHVIAGAPSQGLGQLPIDLMRKSAAELLEDFQPTDMKFKPAVPGKISSKQKRFMIPSSGFLQPEVSAMIKQAMGPSDRGKSANTADEHSVETTKSTHKLEDKKGHLSTENSNINPQRRKKKKKVGN